MRDKELHVGQVEGWVRCRRRKLNQKREQEAEAKAQTVSPAPAELLNNRDAQRSEGQQWTE